ncbi:MAG: hypothetical protein OSB25_10545 [Salibacteraceae bacterium]|nr:hypothetical protein [Salibacteraceae bacterium]|tara:strand:- start:19549 stop:19821 length:273 start_codon:yes stop_codon:yes gene_type:complete
MNENKNSTSGVKLWIIFGLFIGLIVGLIVYEVRLYMIAIEQRENYESVRKKQSEDLKKVFKETIELESTIELDNAQKESNQSEITLSDSL